MPTSLATLQTIMAVSAGEEETRRWPAGCQATPVTGLWHGRDSRVTQLLEGRDTTLAGSTCHTSTPDYNRGLFSFKNNEKNIILPL